MSVPLFVLGSGGEAQTVLRRLAREGWQVRDGFALPEARWDMTEARLVLHGRIPDADTAQLAIHAASRGAGVVAIVDEKSDLARLLTADLGRIGNVRRKPEEPSPVGVLAEEQRALLERLANGETIAAAAAAEYLSLRTANRRIAQAREALGVRTTREAVLAYVRLTRG